MPPIMSQPNNSRVFLGLGGNLGEPLKQFRRVRQQLSACDRIGQIHSSPLYQTPPVGGPAGQPDFLNAVLEIHTGLSPRNLLKLCQTLENRSGRTRDIHWGPRTLDIDLLLYSDLILNDSQLTVPHPHMHQRHFVLLPLGDLDRHLHHPVLKQSVGALLKQLPSVQDIVRLQDSW